MKIDISKYFYTINHDVLKNNLINNLGSDEFNLLCKIIDSTNKSYINNIISKLEKKHNLILPKYNYNEGLPIGNLTSQFLAIFYLSKLQHYILNDLHITYVNFMDDYVLIHESKKYLKYSLDIIIEKLEKEYKLKINSKKTFIKNSKGGITFLGYLFIVKNNKTIIKITSGAKRNIRKGIKKTRYLYNNNFIDFEKYFCSMMSYKKGRKYISQRKINEIITNIG